MSSIKLIYSEKAKKFREISILDLSYVVAVKSMVEILQNVVAFPEYINFMSSISEQLNLDSNRVI